MVKQRITRPKGTGAHYALKIKRLSPTHRMILRVVARHGPITKQKITSIINDKAMDKPEPFKGGFTISGRLSELCGLKLVIMKYKKVELVDPIIMTFRHLKKPLWSITDKGLKVLKTGKLN